VGASLIGRRALAHLLQRCAVQQQQDDDEGHLKRGGDPDLVVAGQALKHKTNQGRSELVQMLDYAMARDYEKTEKKEKIRRANN
jgi:hypothetical protein